MVQADFHQRRHTDFRFFVSSPTFSSQRMTTISSSSAWSLCGALKLNIVCEDVSKARVGWSKGSEASICRSDLHRCRDPKARRKTAWVAMLRSVIWQSTR